jgi:hypothetical protein
MWKPVAVALVLLAATIYAALVIHEISRRMQLGEERRARTLESRALVDEQWMLGTIWAHRHHPFDATWCPDYSPSFRQGCVAAISRSSADIHDAGR